MGLSVAAVALTCGGRTVPHPRFVQQPTSALVEVPYPPPPARVELVPDRPYDDAVWVDGEWTWQGRRWAWRPGRWVVVPPGVFFSPWTTVRAADGTLYIAEGAWRNAEGTEVPAPPVVEPGKARPATVVSPEGELEKVAPTRAPYDAGTEQEAR
jgi:hypothetical protein